MRKARIEVRQALDVKMPPLSDQTIEDSLWHYYYDVNRTVQWLQGTPCCCPAVLLLC